MVQIEKPDHYFFFFFWLKFVETVKEATFLWDVSNHLWPQDSTSGSSRLSSLRVYKHYCLRVRVTE